MNYLRAGSGKPLLLVHGLGGSSRSWSTIFDTLSQQRDVIAVDLPGFGTTPPLQGEASIRTLADALTQFLAEHELTGIDAVGSSMGARLVLELARRGGVVGAVVALSPGGFWQGWERTYFYQSIWASIRLVRALQPALPLMTRYAASRSLLFAQFSPKPWALPRDLVLDELRSFASSRSFDELLEQLAYGQKQQGAPVGAIGHRHVIGWGRQDKVCLPQQAQRALNLFPEARLKWFDNCGHFPHWDQPGETVQLILESV